MSLEDQTKLFFSILHEGMEHERAAIHGYLNFGRRMRVIRDTGVWKALGYAHSYREAVEKEARRSYSYVSKAIRVEELYGALIDKQLMPDMNVDHTKLIETLPLFKKKSDKVEDPSVWLHRAMACSSRDFKNHIREAKGKISTDNCSHPREVQEHWVRCRLCGRWHPDKIPGSPVGDANSLPGPLKREEDVAHEHV